MQKMCTHHMAIGILGRRRADELVSIARACAGNILDKHLQKYQFRLLVVYCECKENNEQMVSQASIN